MRFILLLLGFAYLHFAAVTAQAGTSSGPRVLVVVAHPDDEYYFAATLYRLAKEKNATVDEMILTSGEGGFRYADLALPIYDLNLKDEAVSLKHLGQIRQREAKNAAKILGIHESIFLSVKDFGYTRDLNETLKKWDTSGIQKKILDQLSKYPYDAIFVLAPIESTHGHHKAASLLTLQAIAELPMDKRPLVFAGVIDVRTRPFADSEHEVEVTEGRSFKMLPGFPVSKIDSDARVFSVDRNQRFGFHEKLSYQIVVNWMIAEHKSQGLLQTLINRDDEEKFKLFSISGPDSAKRAVLFFDPLKK